MTSPVGVIGLAFGGFDLQRADLNILFTITEGLDTLPDLRGQDQLIPFRDGRLPGRRTADRRPIIATGWVAGAAPAPQASYRAYLDDLKAALDPTRDPAALVATLEDGSVRWCIATPRNVIPGNTIGNEFRALSIEWESVDPYWYGRWGGLALDTGEVLDDALYLDSSTPMIVTPLADPQLLTLDSLGTADVQRLRITFSGPSTGSPGFAVDLPTGETIGFQVATTLAPANELVVDNFARLLLLDGAPVRSLATLFDGNRYGEYARLSPGANRIRILGKPSKVRIDFNPTYL